MAYSFFFPFVFVFGLIVGSFLNCAIYRLEIGKSFLRGRSFCPYCRQMLSWQDLIPVFSFIFLKRKCRYCQKPISWQYPLVEISTALTFFLIFKQFSDFNFLTLLFYWAIASFLILIFVYDLKHYIIPDKAVYSAIGVAFFYRLFEALSFGRWSFSGNLESITLPMLSAIGAAAFFLFIVLVSRGRWMGVGDIKLAFLMGLVLAWPNILTALFLAFFIGAVIGTGLIFLNKKTLKSEIPFGPFLVAGTFLALFWGYELINLYQELFLVK